MPETLWSQDVFSKGELSPLMYSRVSVDAYYKGLKTASNILTYPQGAAGKRFGTNFLAEITGVTSYKDIFFSEFQYYNECLYLLVFIPDKILIYLEGVLIDTVTSTGIPAAVIATIDSTILTNRFRVCASKTDFKPHDLVRSAAAANVITGFTATTLTLTAAVTASLILPVRFTTNDTLPVTAPQIRTGHTYFMWTTSTSAGEIYSNAIDAKARTNKYAITNAGLGTNNVHIMNTWTFAAVPLVNLPFFDFERGYDGITFTVATASGSDITVTLSGILTAPATLDSKYIGGVFSGSTGGIGRIISVGSTTSFKMDIAVNFVPTVAQPGISCFLAEPAWSNARGWPLKCSSFQSRAYFANTDSLPNGLWGSVVNGYNNFYDLQPDDDLGIARYPSSDNVNYIKFIVPYRSLTIHTNSGVYSTPLAEGQALTPKNFSLSLQDSTPATVVEPRSIDNQIVVLSGNDVHSLLWDGFNSAYTSSIASVTNEHLIRDPIDEIEYLDLNHAGSRYIFIINADGTMAIFQTLISENVSGFTPAFLTQSYGNAYFRWGTSSADGRCWFITEREIAGSIAGINITGFTASTLTAVASNYSLTTPIQVMFETTGTLPVSLPQIAEITYYWVLGVTANTFMVYASKADALADENAYVFSSAGSTSTVIGWPLVTKFYIEEISFTTYVDCATLYSGSALSSIASQPRFNGQEILINGDGYGFDDLVTDGVIELNAHGWPVVASEIQAGFPIDVVIESLPIAPSGSGGYKTTGFIFSQHVRVAALTFVDSVGGYVNGQPITMQTMSQFLPGAPPSPTTGSMQISIMKGWSDYLTPAIKITHAEPFDIKLTGLFYKIEV